MASLGACRSYLTLESFIILCLQMSFAPTYSIWMKM
jgi:hypothetical protein